MSRLAIVGLLVVAVFLVGAASQNSAGPSLQELLKQAQAGDAGAQAQLARSYEDGNGVPQSDELAAEWYRKAAEQGNAGAQNSLGVLYWRGRGVEADKAEAVRWYKKAAKQGLAEAAFNVGISYYNGEGLPWDLDLAYAWIPVAQSRGSPQATEPLNRIGNELHGRLDLSKIKLAALYERGDELPKDLSAAAKIYLELAQEDYKRSLYVPRVQFKLCQLYATGVGVPQDFAEAKSRCKKAAEPPNGALGDRVEFAMIGLGQLEEHDKNWKEAEGWYEKAIMAGDGEGFLPLARLKMQSGPSGEREAYFWLYLAKQFDVPGADAELQQAAARLSVGDISKQQKRAEDWLWLHARSKAKKSKQP